MKDYGCARRLVPETALPHGLLILFALVLAFAAPSSARAQSFVFGKVTLTTGTTPIAVTQGDFNGDGVLDFAVSNSGSNTISVFLSKSNGTYTAKTDYDVSTPGQIVVGDFNLDGKVDLAVATGSNLEVLLGNGDGTFQSPAPQSIAASGLVAADFNQDGKLDLFIAGSASGLYLGNGNGTFSLSGATLGSYSYVNAADFNGDGKLDLLLSGTTTGQVYLGNGSGGFTAAAGTVTTGGQMPAVADFNGDGKLDIAVEITSCAKYGCHYNLDTYLGAGDGTFTFAFDSVPGAAETQLIADDFNQDGKQDLLVVPSGLMLGNGDGSFQAPVAVPLGITPAGAVVGDFNNDGQLDIAALDKSGTLALSVGNHGNFPTTVSTVPADLGPQTVFADLNGDGKLDQISYGSTYPNIGLVVQLGNGDGTFQAPLITPGVSMGGSIAVGDFNNDGKLDLAINGPGSTTLTFAIYLGNGDGSFQAPIVTSSNVYALSMAAADLNGDGKLDVIFTAQNGANLVVYLGNGDGTFGPPTYYSNTCYSTGLVVADFNQDGKPDVAVPCGALDILIGNGDGTLQPAVGYGTTGSGPIVAGDFNGDGKVDVAVGASVFLGNGDGTFQIPSGTLASVDALFLTAGDFNQDGKTDLAMLIYPTSGSITRLFFGNADGTFTPSFLLGNPSTGLANGDLNGDGAPDLFAVTPGTSTSSAFTTMNVPVALLAPGQLNFPNQTVGTTSTPLTLTVSNASIASLTFGATSISGDFAVTSNSCSGTIASGASCTLEVTFTPTVLGSRTGLVTIASNSFGGAANLVLAGNGAVSGAQVQLSASSLTFGNQAIGTTSPSQIVTVTSSGGGPVTFSSFVATGDFAETNNCPTVLNPSATCTVSVRFVPTATGTRTGSLVISDNAPGGSQSVSLSGTGTAPSVTLKPASLTFSTQVLNTSSAAKNVTLTNTGTAALTISSVTFSGANPTSFTETNTCGTSVAAGASCSISVKFKPTTINTLTATLNINDNAAGSPQTVSLTGTGTQVQLSPKSISFGSVTVGTKSAVKKVTLTNVAQTTLSITSSSLTGTNAADFAETTTCGSKVQPEASCTFSITFTPSAKGSRTASLSVSDNGGGSPQTVSLSGTGK